MQTFLPYSNFKYSARVLDNKRLGKQRVEAYQILKIITNQSQSTAWQNHPAVKMWRGYEMQLKIYINCMIEEWKRRGFRNNMEMYQVRATICPRWLGNEALHQSHRSNLLRKNPDYYSQFGWTERNDLPYLWPVK